MLLTDGQLGCFQLSVIMNQSLYEHGCTCLSMTYVFSSLKEIPKSGKVEP